MALDTNFDKNKFNYSGGYLTYNIASAEKPDYVFIARFKYGGGGKPQFQSFLIKNFTVKEYLDRLEGKEAPLEILNSKGYISPNVRRVLKSYSFPASQEGLAMLSAKRQEEARA
jgi:hypothetical protein